MSEIKRWLIYAHDWYKDAHELGDWVKFTDHEKEIKRLEAENKALYDSRKEIMRDCDRMSKSYDFDQAQITKLKRANEIAVKALEAIATSSQKDEFLSDVEYRHRISGIYFSSEKALSEIKGIL